MAATSAPEYISPGRRIFLTAYLEKAGFREKVRFVIRPQGKSNSEAIHVDHEEAVRGSAHLKWKVDAKHHKLPVLLEFEASLPKQPGSRKIVSDPLEVVPPPMKSLWTSFATFRSTDKNKQFHEDTGAHEKLRADFESTKGNLDELSLIATIRPHFDATTKLTGVVWDRLLFNHLKEDSPHRALNFRKLLEICREFDIKLFAGYEAIERPAPNPSKPHFLEFVKSALGPGGTVHQDRVDAHVAAIVNHLFADSATKVDFDGLGFDIELNALQPRFKPVMKALFKGVAEHPKLKGKQVSYATVPFVDHKGTGIGHANSMTQSYELATGIPNLIVRPMIYDVAPVDEKLVKATTDFALAPAPEGAGLKPYQFQAGFKTRKLTENKPQRGVVSEAKVCEFIKNVLSEREVGVIIFILLHGHQKAQYAAYNDFAAAYEA